MNKKLTYILLLCTFLAVNAFAKKVDKPLTPGIQLYKVLAHNKTMQRSTHNQVVLEMYYSAGGDTQPNIDYTLVAEIDGTRVKEQLVHRTGSVYAQKDTLTFSTNNLQLGKHTLKVYIDASKSKVKVSDNSETLELPFFLYTNAVKRQKFLVEQFTATWCHQCPAGTRYLGQVAAERGDIAWVAVYCDGAYCAKISNTLKTTYAITGYPQAVFNRVMVSPPSFAYSINTYQSAVKSAAERFFGACEKDNPAFVTLDIDALVNKETALNNRTLDITIHGKGVEQAAQLLSNQKINVYVLENKLSSYNHVLRSCLTGIDGGNITWQGDNFTYKCTYNIPANYNPENMQVVAFVAPPINEATKDKTDLLHYAVNQTNIVDVKMVTNGIECIKQPHNTDEPVAYYNLSGQLIKQPSAHGVYMVKYKSGKIKKQVAM